MPASRSTKAIIWMIVGLLTIGVATVATSFYRAWHKFSTEEQFCGAFHPVISGITQFQESKGTFPTNLTQLVPAYIHQLPTAPVADSIDYRVIADGTDWQLIVHSHIMGMPRVFLQRFSHGVTDDERRRSVTGFHGWLVLKE